MMDIHQIQVKYDALADRLLLQIRTRDEQLFPIWLTRRMVIRLWPHFRGMVSGLAVTRSAPSALAVPEARDMLADAARERALSVGDEIRDIEAARVVGLKAAAVAWGFGIKPALEAAKPDVMFETVGELRDFLRTA